MENKLSIPRCVGFVSHVDKKHLSDSRVAERREEPFSSHSGSSEKKSGDTGSTGLMPLEFMISLVS